jgi:hypothetical protein
LARAPSSSTQPVEREARHGFPQPLLEHGGEDPVGRQPLYVDPHRLVNEVVGEAPPWPGALAFERERGAARVAQKALERLKGTARARRSSRGLAVTFGVQARALSGNGHGERLAIYARRSPIRLDLGERGSQVVLGALSVGDAVPSSFAPVGRSPWPSATGTAASASHRTSVDADPSAPLPGRRFATRSRSDPSPDTAALLGLRAARRRRIESPGITPALSLLRSV